MQATLRVLVTSISVICLVFFIVRWVPGNPVDTLLGDGASPEARENLTKLLGLDQPWPKQLQAFLSDLSHGDFGQSISRGTPVATLLAERIPSTLTLGLIALMIATLSALLLGTCAALFRSSFIDRIVLFLSVVGISVPNFWLGPMLVLFFAVYLGILPVSGNTTWAHIILPAATLGFSLFSTLVRVVRASLLETFSSDYIRTAIAKGNSSYRTYGLHALKNALLPIITQISLQAGAVLAGTLVTETIFDWPGIGSLMFQAIKSRDYPLIQGTVLVVSLSYVFINYITDVIYAWADPRLRR